MRAKFNWEPANKMVSEKSIARLRKAAKVVAKAVRRECPVGTVTRPPYVGQPLYTRRIPGSLKKTIRIVELKEERWGFAIKELGITKGLVRVYAGNWLAYYAQMVEYYTPFMRPAVEETKSEVRSIIENG